MAEEQRVKDSPSRYAAEEELVEQEPGGEDVVEAAVLEQDDLVIADKNREPNRADLASIEANEGDAELDEQRSIADAQLGEEIDALAVDNSDEPRDIPDQRDGSGRIVDEVAYERMEELTESGKEAGEVGVLPQDAGRDDTSEKLRENNPQDKRLPFGESEEDNVLPDAKLQEDEEGL
jgi:hypothetical protein